MAEAIDCGPGYRAFPDKEHARRTRNQRGRRSGQRCLYESAWQRSGGPNLSAGALRPTNPPGSASVVRLHSHSLFYAENDHKAVFSGGVVAQTSTGTLHSGFMDIYFSTATVSEKKDQSSAVSKIIARSAVQLEQPGRKGTGEELTYTAEDGKFVLIGNQCQPPRLSDQVRGTVTGSALIFNDRDDSVVVSGGASKAVTQTHVAK